MNGTETHDDAVMWQLPAWEGPAAERFRTMWSGEYEVALRKVQQALVDAGAEVSRRQGALQQAGS